MRDIAIRVEKPSKQSRIGKAQERHDTLRDSSTMNRMGGRSYAGTARENTSS